MLLRELKDSPKVIGTKQVKKAISKGLATIVLIAGDAEPHIIEPIKELCRQNQVEIQVVDSMETLGDACGIEVGSATVAVINNQAQEV